MRLTDSTTAGTRSRRRRRRSLSPSTATPAGCSPREIEAVSVDRRARAREGGARLRGRQATALVAAGVDERTNAGRLRRRVRARGRRATRAYRPPVVLDARATARGVAAGQGRRASSPTGLLPGALLVPSTRLEPSRSASRPRQPLGASGPRSGAPSKSRATLEGGDHQRITCAEIRGNPRWST